MNNQVRFPFPPTSDDEAEIPEVFAHAGMVLFLGQVLEHGIVNLLVCEYMLSVKKSTRRRLKNAEIATFVARARDLEGEHFEETMGQLLKNMLKSGITVPPTLKELLKESLTGRNRLAHRFFREHAMNFGNSAGRLLMMAELAQMRGVLERAAHELDLIFHQISNELGVTEEQLAEIGEVYRDAATQGLTEKDVEEILDNQQAKKEP
jgi:hypothetical protein